MISVTKLCIIILLIFYVLIFACFLIQACISKLVHSSITVLPHIMMLMAYILNIIIVQFIDDFAYLIRSYLVTIIKVLFIFSCKFFADLLKF